MSSSTTDSKLTPEFAETRRVIVHLGPTIYYSLNLSCSGLGSFHIISVLHLQILDVEKDYLPQTCSKLRTLGLICGSSARTYSTSSRLNDKGVVYRLFDWRLTILKNVRDVRRLYTYQLCLFRYLWCLFSSVKFDCADLQMLRHRSQLKTAALQVTDRSRSQKN